MLVLDPATPTVYPKVHIPVARWSLASRIAFRFGFLYFGIYVVMTQMLYSLLMLRSGIFPDSRWFPRAS